MDFLKRLFRRNRSSRRGYPKSNATRLGVESMERRDLPSVAYFGGNVLPHVEAQALYLGDRWSNSSATADQRATVDNFLTDVTGGAYMDALTRAGYGVGRGTASAAAVDNVSIPGNSSVSDAAIQRRIQTDINNGLLRTPDANRLYVVYVEPNVAVNLGAGQGTTQQGILGYHGAFAGTDVAGRPAVIRYAVVAYPGGTVGNSSMGTAAIDQLTAVTSHELAEAVTDPDVNYGRLGWYDSRRGEIGDVSESDPSALVRLDGYLVQEVVDKNDRLLAIDPSSSGAPAPSTPPTTPAPPSTAVNTTTTITAGPVHYPRRRFGLPSVTITLSIDSASDSMVPGGVVGLFANGTLIGATNISVVNGVATATFNVQFFAHGTFSFQALYLGTTQFHGSVSQPVRVIV